MDLVYTIIVIIVVLLLIFIITSNRLEKRKIKIEESTSGIDVALVKRHDVLTKTIEVVKGYMKYEKETLFEIVKLRSDMKMNEKIEENKKMDNNTEKINAVAEDYPELKASEQFIKLQKAIVDAEEHLQAARRCYNANVRTYNELALTFPSNLVAKIRGMKEVPFFEASKEDKEKVDVKL